MAEPALRVEGVGKARRAPGGARREILRQVELSVARGELTAIVGPSGGGKSTLIRLLNRLEDPDSGRILLAGEDVAALDPLLLRRRVALVPQQPFLFEGSVLANLQRPFVLRGEAPPSEQSDLLREALELCRVPAELLSQSARTLSIGQQQRVCLARALATCPEVLLLDEPTSALDRPTADRLARDLRALCRKRDLAVLMVTHDLRLAGRVADRLAYLEDGAVLESGPAEELLNRPRSEQLRRFLAGADGEVG